MSVTKRTVLSNSRSLVLLGAALILGGCGTAADAALAEGSGAGGGGGLGSTGNGGAGGTRLGSGGRTGMAGAGGGHAIGGGGRTGGFGAGGSSGATGSGASGGPSSNGAASGGSGIAGAGGSGTPQTITCTPQTWDTAPVGWATQGGGTTGGGNATPVMVTTLAQLNAAVKGAGAAVIHVSGTIAGTVSVGSNKTILGLCGAAIHGSLNMSGSSNVIVRNLKIVGNNCTDSPNDCSAGADAVHVEGGDKHLWFDHLDISDGSDGNLDITHGSDFITVSWTKFHYSTKRTDPVAGANGHRFCNLIGHVDTNGAEDAGHLNVTFYDVWWADNVNQRMPRVRFGKVHVFNSLYTATGDTACIEVGVSSDIRSENNVFQGVSSAVDGTHANAASIIQSLGNQGSSTNIGGPAFTPPYAYSAVPAASVASAVMSGAGPK